VQLGKGQADVHEGLLAIKREVELLLKWRFVIFALKIMKDGWDLENLFCSCFSGHLNRVLN